MKLKQLGANKTLLTLKNGVQVFLSYETPVAARLENSEYVRPINLGVVQLQNISLNG